MDGLEAVELKLSEIEDGNRIDAELYQKKFVEFTKKLKTVTTTTLNKEADIIKKGIFDIKANVYSSKGIPFVRIGNLKNMLIDTSDIIYIPKSENEKNLETFLRRDDIILSKTATAAASLVNIDYCNTSQDTVAIKLKKGSQLLSHYVVVFLNTDSGKKEMQRWFTGNIQMHLNLTDCKNKMLIPILSIQFQKEIKQLFVKSIQLKNKSKFNYTEANTLLLNELGLHNWQPTKANTEIKSFKNSFLQSGRLDAEYYQPKYDEIIKKIKRYPNGHFLLQKACVVNDKNYNPKLTYGYKYVELANVDGSGSINGCINDIGANLPSRARRNIKEGDVIVSSIEGSLQSCALVTKEYDEALCSTGFYVLRSDKINSETLLVILKSPLLQLLLKQNCSGTILTSVNRVDLDKIVLPIIKKNVQQQIAELIQQSFSLKKQSERLLQTAKQAVEMAIEEGEERAMAFIN